MLKKDTQWYLNMATSINETMKQTRLIHIQARHQVKKLLMQDVLLISGLGMFVYGKIKQILKKLNIK